jgi:hypothetical protein
MSLSKGAVLSLSKGAVLSLSKGSATDFSFPLHGAGEADRLV